MKNTSFIILFLFSFIFTATYETSAQIDSMNKRKLEIGLDFVGYNNFTNPFNFFYQPDNVPEFRFDYIPAFFVRSPFGKNSIRFKYEYAQFSGLYSTNSFDFWSHIDGKLSHNCLLFGFERNFINSRLKFYGSIDLGLSHSVFKGLYSSFNGWSLEHIINEPQKIKAYGISINPGIGFKYDLSNKVSLTIESSLTAEKIKTKNDPHYVYDPSLFIIRPISLVGVSYSFMKSK